MYGSFFRALVQNQNASGRIMAMTVNRSHRVSAATLWKLSALSKLLQQQTRPHCAQFSCICPVNIVGIHAGSRGDKDRGKKIDELHEWMVDERHTVAFSSVNSDHFQTIQAKSGLVLKRSAESPSQAESKKIPAYIWEEKARVKSGGKVRSSLI